jgi:hypothetical protein
MQKKERDDELKEIERTRAKLAKLKVQKQKQIAAE